LEFEARRRELRLQEHEAGQAQVRDLDISRADLSGDEAKDIAKETGSAAEPPMGEFGASLTPGVASTGRPIIGATCANGGGSGRPCANREYLYPAGTSLQPQRLSVGSPRNYDDLLLPPGRPNPHRLLRPRVQVAS
jgi:hypothetical protein